MRHPDRSASHEAIDELFIRCLSLRLRQARQMRRMTLRALAEAALCSESLLSKFENGKNHPSLPTLARIAQALDVTMSALLGGAREMEPVIYRCEPPFGRSALDVSLGIESEAVDVGRLTSHCSILHIAPGRAGAIDPRHDGEETGIVLEGRPSLVVNGCSHELDVGDAFVFRAEQPHGYQNGGATRARIFRVFTPSGLAA